MNLKQPLLLTIIILIISILFVPQDKINIATFLAIISIFLGLVYWKIK